MRGSTYAISGLWLALVALFFGRSETLSEARNAMAYWKSVVRPSPKTIYHARDLQWRSIEGRDPFASLPVAITSPGLSVDVTGATGLIRCRAPMEGVTVATERTSIELEMSMTTFAVPLETSGLILDVAPGTLGRAWARLPKLFRDAVVPLSIHLKAVDGDTVSMEIGTTIHEVSPGHVAVSFLTGERPVEITQYTWADLAPLTRPFSSAPEGTIAVIVSNPSERAFEPVELDDFGVPALDSSSGPELRVGIRGLPMAWGVSESGRETEILLRTGTPIVRPVVWLSSVK